MEKMKRNIPATAAFLVIIAAAIAVGVFSVQMLTSETDAVADPVELNIPERIVADEPVDEKVVETKSKETARIKNPSGTREFYFKNEQPVFVLEECRFDEFCLNSSNPLDIFFNGDSVFVVEPIGDGSRADRWLPEQIIHATVSDTVTGVASKLLSIGKTTAWVGGVTVVGWIDDEHLMVQSGWGDGPGAGGSYLSVDVVTDAIESEISWWVSYADGYVAEIVVGDLGVVQGCDEEDGPCENIHVYRDIPDDVWYPYESLTPVATVSTEKPMELPTESGVKTFFQSNQKHLTVSVGGGSFKLNISNGIVSALKDL